MIENCHLASNSYALTELRKDLEAELSNYPEAERKALRAATKFAVFVVHNKKKQKLAELPSEIPLVLLASSIDFY